MGLAAMIGSTGMEFIANRTTTRRLPEGAEIPTQEPVQLGDTFSDSEIQKVAENIKSLLENLRRISASVDRNQAMITASIADIGDITREIAKTTETLPGLVETAQEGFATWQRAGQSVFEVVEGSRTDLDAITGDIRGSSHKLNSIMTELEQLTQHANRLVQDLEQGSAELPALIADGRILLRSAGRLSDQLSRHWLLGGGKADDVPRPSTGLHPDDRRAYEIQR
jgi:ABC-type transporter Mla subunit MlaD